MDVLVGLNAVIVAIIGDAPAIRLSRAVDRSVGELEALRDATGGRAPSLPFGSLDPVRHRTLDSGLRSWVEDQTGLTLGYVEQLYTFGDQGRDPRERRGGPRVLSIGYLALTRSPGDVAADHPDWRSWYDFFPWEDWRAGEPAILTKVIGPALDRWIAATTGGEAGRRRERAEMNFGLGGAPWDSERILERYELLYEASLVPEAPRDQGRPPDRKPPLGQAMMLDHRRILATAMGRLRGKIKYRPVVFELMPPTFTLLQLQRAVEALAGAPLHKQNFRRLVEQTGLVERTGMMEGRTGGRPAEQFRFRHEILLERPASGVGSGLSLPRRSP
jgi:hypothetical protein